MRKSLIILFLTVISVSRLTSQGLTWENRDNYQILQISATTNLTLTLPAFELAGVLQENDSILLIKSRYYYHGLRAKHKVLSGLMKMNREANVKFQNNVILNIVSIPVFLISGFCGTYASGEKTLEKQSKNILYGISAGCFVAGLALESIAGNMKLNAIKIYNQGLNKTSYYPQKEVKIGFVGNGIGVNYRF